MWYDQSCASEIGLLYYLTTSHNKYLTAYKGESRSLQEISFHLSSFEMALNARLTNWTVGFFTIRKFSLSVWPSWIKCFIVEASVNPRWDEIVCSEDNFFFFTMYCRWHYKHTSMDAAFTQQTCSSSTADGQAGAGRGGWRVLAEKMQALT